MTVTEYESRRSANVREYARRVRRNRPVFDAPPPAPKRKYEPPPRAVWSEWVRDSDTIRNERLTARRLHWIGQPAVVNVSVSRRAGTVPAPAGFNSGGIVSEYVEISIYVRPGSSEVKTMQVAVGEARAMEELLRNSGLEIAHRRHVTFAPSLAEAPPERPKIVAIGGVFTDD